MTFSAEASREQFQIVRGCQHLIAAELRYQFQIENIFFFLNLQSFRFQLFKKPAWVF